MTKELPLPDILRKVLRYDPDTGKLFWRERSCDFFKNPIYCDRWNERYAGKQAFIIKHNAGYMQGAIFDKKYLAHRVIWAIVMGSWPAMQIDHINGKRSDNRLANLRDVSPSENAMNTIKHSNNTSGHNGVSWNKKYRYWAVWVTVNKKPIWLGSYKCKQKAILARKEGERRFAFTDRHGCDLS